MLVSALAVMPGLSAEAAAASGDLGSPPPLQVNITNPGHDEILDESSVMVTWVFNIPEEDLWFCEVQLDALPIQRAQANTSHVFQGVTEGYHTVKVWIHNTTGAMATDSESFMVDLGTPSLKIISPVNSAKLNNSTVNVAWNATDSSFISFFEVWLDGGNYQRLLPTVNNLDFEVIDGPHNVKIKAYDRAGNNETAMASFIVDTVPPTVQITSPADDVGFNVAHVTVTWDDSSIDPSLKGYEVWVDQAYVITAITSVHQYANDYADGYHTVTIVAVDEAGNTASDSATFFVDTAELTIVAHDPAGDNEQIDALITIQFSKEMDRGAISATVNGVAGTVTWDGPTATVAPSSPLSCATTYTVAVTGKDLVGNSITYSWSFTTTNTGTIIGIVKDDHGNPLSGAKVTLDGGESVTTDATGAYSFQAPAGTHEIRITKAGWDPRTYGVEVVAGDDFIVSDKNMVRSSILGLLGILAAVIAVAVVGVLFYFSRYRKKERGPPTAARSWRGMSELQKRAMQSSKRIDDDDDDLDRL